MPIKRLRRIACPELQTPQGAILTQYVVEIVNGKVKQYYPLERELPFTEWTTNCLNLRKNEQGELMLYDADKPIL